MGLKVKLVKSSSGSSERQMGTLIGLGLTKFGSEKLLKDTPETRGMVKKMRHLVSMEVVKEEPVLRKRTKPAKIRAREAKAAAAAKAK